MTWEPELDDDFIDHYTSGIWLQMPLAVLDSANSDMFGPFLSFEQGIRALPVADPSWMLEPSSGFLYSFSGTLPVFEAGRTSVIFGCWPQSEAAGIESTGKWSAGLRAENDELVAGLATPDGTQGGLKSRATIRVPSSGGAGCTSRNQPFTASLAAGEVHWLVLSYSANSGLALFIDGRCAAHNWAPSVEGEDDVAAATLVGSGILGAYYAGRLQQLNVLRWESTGTDGVN